MENYSEFLFHCNRDRIERFLGAEARTMIYVLVGQRKGHSGLLLARRSFAKKMIVELLEW